MNKTEIYIREKYKTTKWPYLGLKETKFVIGESFDRDLKELKEKEMIKPTSGINDWLIELINLNKWQ